MKTPQPVLPYPPPIDWLLTYQLEKFSVSSNQSISLKVLGFHLVKKILSHLDSQESMKLLLLLIAHHPLIGYLFTLPAGSDYNLFFDPLPRITALKISRIYNWAVKRIIKAKIHCTTETTNSTVQWSNYVRTLRYLILVDKYL